jgi:Mycoplasma protein of unknown function, DUF285
MSGMFALTDFVGDISGWVVSKVISFDYMFASNIYFNGDLSSWDVQSARSLNGMFLDAIAFNQPLSRYVVLFHSL